MLAVHVAIVLQGIESQPPFTFNIKRSSRSEEESGAKKGSANGGAKNRSRR